MIIGRPDSFILAERPNIMETTERIVDCAGKEGLNIGVNEIENLSR